ncbi:hypothetical protein [Enterocloster clostridioformis]|uniref:hypothetical protein n=1 Tax=Enterocloster clostridioformis TaxID=1531 RepID=UPI001CE18CF4|nr:hypothetical protein [Enterocloster clostridioformis]MCA5580920.1 hypothetical protein [Enterocloster clostridioformis]
MIELLCTDYNKKATSIHYYFGNAVLVAGFAIVLNLILPKDKTDQEVEAEYIREISQTEEDGAASAKAHEVETA